MHTNPIPPTDELNVEKAPAPSPGEVHTNPIPATKDLNVEKAPIPSPGPTNTDPFNAPTSGESTLPRDTKTGVIPVLGNVISGPNTSASTATPAHTAPVINEHPSVAIEKVAANANIGQEPTDHEQTMLEKAQAYGMGAATTLTSAIGQAVHTVEEKTGLHLLQGDPVSTQIAILSKLSTDNQMTVEEARAKGIDVDHLAKVDGPTDATSPVGTTPSSAAVSDLEKKVQELKVANSSVPAADVAESKKSLTAVPLPGGEPPKSKYSSPYNICCADDSHDFF
jgi:hypothetical protein